MIRWVVNGTDERGNLLAVGKTEVGQWAFIRTPADVSALEWMRMIEFSDIETIKSKLNGLIRHTDDESLIAFVERSLAFIRDGEDYHGRCQDRHSP
jgi:hypothetical protein